jgi:hypothetical protein
MTGLLSCPRQYLASSPTRWYVVFCEVTERSWWDALFRTPVGFSHVYALRWDGWNWLLLNPHAAFTDIMVVAARDEGQLAELVEPGATVIEVQAFRPTDQVRGRWWVGPMTCVEQVKALLGIAPGWIFTPWQLYRYLTRPAHVLAQAQDSQAQPVGNRAAALPTIRARRVDPRQKRAPQGAAP